MGAALHQHTLLGRPGERRHDRHRCRDHERAWASDDEQHERAVEPHAPSAVHEQGRQEEYCNGEDHHDGRVDFGELLHPLLARRAPALRRADHADDLRQRRVVGRLGGDDVERAFAIDSAGEDLVALSLEDGHAFAGDRRLIHFALAGGDSPVERYLVAGPDDDVRTELDLASGNLAFGAVLQPYPRCGRCEFHERRHRPPCTS